ncbi:ribosomal protein S18-alanine N-acetyltransferase [Orbaceae bacterium ESL0727]|nr:ribosomal protein S18-alanine N-acetyltransferase [Orbaceae bacterium ESL0727]
MKTISSLNSADLPAAYQLEQICHAFPWSRNTFYSNQGEHYFNQKITLNNQLVGFCICHLVADEASLFNIAIDPAFRRQGLAKALLTSLINQLATQSSHNPIKTIWLEVRASNQAAIHLYNSLGFNELTIRKNYYPAQGGKQEDAIIMAYTLL